MAANTKRDDFVPEGMKHSDFKIGLEFLSGSGRWRCTDVGKRTIAALKLDHDHDPAGITVRRTQSPSMFSTSTTSWGSLRHRSGAPSTTADDRKL
jgi:hypothetical protein